MANLHKIRKLQENKRIEFNEVAEYIDYTPQGLRTAIKNGKIMTDALEKIAAYFQVPVGYFFDECEATGFIGGHNIVQTMNGHTINQTIGEIECHRQLEVALEKIRGLEEQIKVLKDFIEVLKKK